MLKLGGPSDGSSAGHRGPGRKMRAVNQMMAGDDQKALDDDSEYPSEVVSNLKHLTHPRSEEEKMHVADSLPRGYKRHLEEQGKDLHDAIEDHPVTFHASHESDVSCSTSSSVLTKILLCYVNSSYSKIFCDMLSLR